VIETFTGHVALPPAAADLAAIVFEEKLMCYRQSEILEKHYNENNASIFQTVRTPPAWLDDIASVILAPERQYVTSVIKVPPGNTVPLHVDGHFMLREKIKADPDTTYRILIFLQDWASGHYFECRGRPRVQWRAGDWMCFTNRDLHLAGNMGQIDFYTAQITFA